MTLALAGLIVLLLLALAHSTIQARRHDDRIDRLLSLHAGERAQTTPDLAALISLVENLCQRVQAPTQAVIDHSIAQPMNPGPTAVNPEDDNSYWAAQELSKEALAMHAFDEELHAA